MRNALDGKRLYLPNNIRGELRLSSERGIIVGAFVILAMLAAGFMAYSGTFYTTGKQWYEACWARQQGIKATDPYSDAMRAECEPSASRAMFGSGLLYASSDGKDKDAARLEAVCPSSWTDHFGGDYILAIKTVQFQGGPGILDRVLPASLMLERAFTARWPDCSAERARQGYPMIVEKSPGRFDWSYPCPKCGPG